MPTSGYQMLRISIHVPMRGTTMLDLFLIIFKLYFNPRPHEGDDFFLLDTEKVSLHFNPRPHEGDDHKYDYECNTSSIFQSTSP